jgi:glyoxylase-like metal-dependent hydrolase (beta-lactamase superfamily II)
VARKNLDGARDFDGRWYVERPLPLRWPDRLSGLKDGETFAIGGAKAEVFNLPGHSEDGLALRFGGEGVMLVGDYLSPCEIPFVENVARYQQTLRRLDGLLGAVGEVIPGHGPRLTVPRAREILEQDLAYLDGLARHAAEGDVAGALAMRWPRAQDVPGMRDHHLENCAAAGLKLPAQP